MKNLAANENPGQEEQLSGERFNLIKAFHKFQLTQCLRLGACNTFSKEKKRLGKRPGNALVGKKEKGRPPQCDFIRSSSMNSMQNCFSIMVPKIFGQRLNQHSSIDTEAQGHRDVTGAQARRFRFPVSPHTYIQIISVSNAFPACYILFLKSVPRYNRR